MSLAALTYKKAGVPHLKGDPKYNQKIKQWIASTRVPGTLGSATGFAAFFDLKKTKIHDPLLVASTDGVGTKLEIAQFQKRHDTIGIDLVAMCVNDLITCGAKPIFFLDYLASGKFDALLTGQILKGIVDGCRQAECALIGGETAIMPGFYNLSPEGKTQYDLAGFSVGLVSRKKVIDGRTVRKGDAVLGIASSGFHSNGYSLLRKIFSPKELRGTIGQKLLVPTRIYIRAVQKVLSRISLQGIANITGGGLIDNLPRIIPQGLTAGIRQKAWPRPKLFQFVQNSGNIRNFEMFRTFNMGIGMVFILAKEDAPKAQAVLKTMNLESWVIGEIIKGRKVEIQ